MSPFIEPLDSRRYLAAHGAADPTFADAGTAYLRVPLTAGQRLETATTVTDSVGRTYVAAEVRPAEDNAGLILVVQRLNADGTRDETWAVRKRGRLKFALPQNTADRYDDTSDGHHLAVDAADRLFVQIGATVYRLTPDGVSDSAYAQNGVLTVDGFTHVRDFAVDARNKLYVAGDVIEKRRSRMSVVRYLSRGRIDKAYASAGRYVAPLFGGAIRPATRLQDETISRQRTHQNVLAVNTDGSLTLAGNTNFYALTDYDEKTDAPHQTYGVQAVRLASDGSPVSTYGVGGVAENAALDDFGSNLGVLAEEFIAGLRPDGALILNRSAYDPSDGEFNLAYLPTPNAADGGLAYNDIHAAGDFWPADRIEYFGRANRAGDVFTRSTLVRFNADGTEDETFRPQIGFYTLVDVARGPGDTLIAVSDPSFVASQGGRRTDTLRLHRVFA